VVELPLPIFFNKSGPIVVYVNQADISLRWRTLFNFGYDIVERTYKSEPKQCLLANHSLPSFITLFDLHYTHTENLYSAVEAVAICESISIKKTTILWLVEISFTTILCYTYIVLLSNYAEKKRRPRRCRRKCSTWLSARN
jgi:hypothetical protein